MKKKSRMKAGIALAIFGAGVLVAIAVVWGAQAPKQSVESHGQPIASVRTVIVDTVEKVSQPSGPLRVVPVSGTFAGTPMMATVMSDENCAPDAMGISHCSNRLRMADGTEMTVMHPHRMSEVPCLAPGEKVRVQAA